MTPTGTGRPATPAAEHDGSVRRLLVATLLATAVLPVACGRGGPASPPADAEAPPAAESATPLPSISPERIASPDDPAVDEWVEAQSMRTRSWIRQHADLEEITGSVRRAWSRERYGLPVRRGAVTFYTHNDGFQPRDVWLVTETLGTPGRVLLDPNAPPLDATAGIANVWPGPTGRRVAYALAEPASRARTLRVRDVGDGADLTGVLQGVAADVPIAWTATGFYYGRRTLPAEPSGRVDQITVWYHRPGTGQEEDVLVFRPDDPMQDAVPYVLAGGRFLVVRLVGPGGDGLQLADLTAGEPRWISLFEPGIARHEPIAVRDGLLYLRTTLAAPRGRVIAIDLARPALESVREAIPETDATLVSAILIGERLAAVYDDEGTGRLEVRDVDGARPLRVELPEQGTISRLSEGEDAGQAYYRVDPPGRPGSVYRLDLTTGVSQPVWPTRAAADAESCVNEQSRFPSDDGIWIGVTLVCGAGLAHTGDHPVLLAPRERPAPEPSSRAAWAGWLELGGVLALVDARGPDSPPDRLLGRDGTEAGVADLISAAEWLIVGGVTRTERLAIAGSGQAGRLVAEAVVRRPDLFAAVLPDSPPAPVQALPPAGACYPATLITVDASATAPEHAYAIAAALQRAQTCAAPILLRVTSPAPADTGARVEETADRLAFLRASLRPQGGDGVDAGGAAGG